MKMIGRKIRVKGVVQGVGFRPFVWNLAQQCHIAGAVKNDGDSVLIEAWGSAENMEVFIQRITAQPPALAKIDDCLVQAFVFESAPSAFVIAESAPGTNLAQVAADAATCAAC
ncbi:MAG TPA: acylphosphatase, partial [Pseudomonadales bacterium]|nr:acylphosphatase [Pseudomonadales bacterium]